MELEEMRVETTQKSFIMMERVLLKASEWTASRVVWGSRTHFRAAAAAEQHPSAYVPLRMASSGAIALWCQTVMSRVQGNTIKTMARISLLFGISRIGYLAWHYLQTVQTDVELTPHLPATNNQSSGYEET